MCAFVQGLRDVIIEPRYDTQQIPAAGTTLLTFFATPQGSGTSVFGGTGAKNGVDTNMTLAGQLPNPYTFTVYGFRLQLAMNVVQADAIIAINAALFTFTVGSKPFLTVPARTIPGGNSIFGSANLTAGAGTQMVGNGWPVLNNTFNIGRYPIVLSPTENFNATLTWPNGVQALSAATNVTCYLDGVLKRGAQ